MPTGSALDDHRLATVESRTVRDRYPRFVGRNANGSPSGRGGSFRLRVLTTDQGATGWAMSWWPDENVPDLIGRKLSDLFDVDTGPADDAITLELPLYDLAARILGMPVYEMLGAQGPTQIPIYTGAIYFDDMEPEDAPRGVAGVVASCRQDHDLGYRAFKLKIGRGRKWIPGEAGWRRDVEVTRAVRQEFPDCRLLVDANDAYSPYGFIDYLRAVADCDLYWIEEPFTETVDDLRRLHDVMDETGCEALIAEGEGRTAHRDPAGPYGGYTEEHIDHLYALAEAKLIDVFLLDLGIVGYSRYRRIMPSILAAGITASPHTWAWTPRSYYTAQLAAGVGGVVIVEGIPGGADGVDYSAYTFDDGDLVMPSEPGFGLRLTG